MYKLQTILKKVILLFAILSASLSLKASDQTWLLTDISLINIETGEINSSSSILIEEGSIKAVNPKKVPKSIKRISGENRWVIPGLSEMHAHVPGDAQYTARILKLFVAHGITNIRGMLGQQSHLALRNQLNSGEKLGPYLVTSGPSVNGNSVKTPEEAVQKIIQQVDAGYDFHKIHPGLSKDSYQAVVQTAKKHNSSWGGHISTDVGIIETLKAGQSTIDHLDGFIEELAIRNGDDLANQVFFGFALAESVDLASIPTFVKEVSNFNYALVPTEALMHSFAGNKTTEELMKNPAHKWMPKTTVNNWKNSRESFWRNEAVTQERAKQFLDVRAKLLLEFQKNDVSILLGSDAPQVFNVPGDSTHRELSLLVDAGLSPLEALQTGTINVNQFYQGKHPVGKIAEGMRADLVLLNKNPLLNINNTREIHAVISAGNLLDRKKLDQILKSLE